MVPKSCKFYGRSEGSEVTTPWAAGIKARISSEKNITAEETDARSLNIAQYNVFPQEQAEEH